MKQSREVIISDLEINEENFKPNLTEKINTSAEQKEETILKLKRWLMRRIIRDNSLKASIDWLNIQKPSHWLIQLHHLILSIRLFHFLKNLKILNAK